MTSFIDSETHIRDLINNDDFETITLLLQNFDYTNEPYFIKNIELLLSKLTNNKTSEQCKMVGELLISKMNPFAMKKYMDALYYNMDSMKWQIKKGALMLLGCFAKHQSWFVKFNLPNMILPLIDMTSDIKIQTRQCFNELCSVIDNVDITKIIPTVIMKNQRN